MQGNIYKKKEGWVIVYHRPARTVFVPVTGQVKPTTQDGDSVDFELQSEKSGVAKISKYITQRPEVDEGVELLREHILKVRQDKLDHLRSQSYARAAACREIEKALETLYYSTIDQNINSIEEINKNTIITPHPDRAIIPPETTVTGSAVYYPRYDVFADAETGEITTPICTCTLDENCIYLDRWIEDGMPNTIDTNKLNK